MQKPNWQVAPGGHGCPLLHDWIGGKHIPEPPQHWPFTHWVMGGQIDPAAPHP